MPDKQWYTNKDLFELISAVQSEFNGLRSEMRETRHLMKQYNGLREEIGIVKGRIDGVDQKLVEIEAESKGRSSVGKAIREWGGWVIAVITFILLLL